MAKIGPRDVTLTAPNGSTVVLRWQEPQMAPLTTGIEQDDIAAPSPTTLKGNVEKKSKPPHRKKPLKGGVKGSGHRPKTTVAPKTIPPPPKQGGETKVQPPPPIHKGIIIPPDIWQGIKCFMLGKVLKHRAGQKTGDKTFDDAKGYEGAGVFDSANFWGNGQDEKDFTFASGPHQGETLKGHEVNYYFQGMIARAYGVRRDKLENIIRTWKGIRYWSQPSEKTLQMARDGYDNYEKDIEDCKNRKP